MTVHNLLLIDVYGGELYISYDAPLIFIKGNDVIRLPHIVMVGYSR